MKKGKNICILIMGVIIVALIVYILLTSTNKKNSFLNDMLNLQANLSYYVGQTKSDTFGAYENLEILTGETQSGVITDYNDEALKAIVEKDSKIEKDGNTFYKVIPENAKEVLKVDLSSYSGLEFYLQDGQYLRVKIITEPSWWNKSFDSLCM